MKIDGWPDYARIAWFSSFIGNMMLSLNARGGLYLREREVSSIAELLAHRAPAGIEWPLAQESDEAICHLRFVEQFRNEDLYARVREEGIETPHKRVPDLERAWGACFQTILHTVRHERTHPLRGVLWETVGHVRPEFVEKLLEPQKKFSAKH